MQTIANYPIVIKRVHELAAKQGFKTLTAQDRKKRHYYPGHLTEGVDYIVDDDEWDDDFNPTKTNENKEYAEDEELEDESAYMTRWIKRKLTIYLKSRPQ